MFILYMCVFENINIDLKFYNILNVDIVFSFKLYNIILVFWYYNLDVFDKYVIYLIFFYLFDFILNCLLI